MIFFEHESHELHEYFIEHESHLTACKRVIFLNTNRTNYTNIFLNTRPTGYLSAFGYYTNIFSRIR